MQHVIKVYLSHGECLQFSTLSAIHLSLFILIHPVNWSFHSVIKLLREPRNSLACNPAFVMMGINLSSPKEQR